MGIRHKTYVRLPYFNQSMAFLPLVIYIWMLVKKWNMKNNKRKRNVFYILAGSMLEHMDSMLFALYLPIVAGYFFDTQSIEAKWTLGFLAFSLYYTVRPFGALILGVIGDKYGRKNALLLSIAMMSLATFAMGIAPSYAQVGFWATVFFLFLRLMQGVSDGISS